jgi:hypothetical protein
MRPSLLPTVLFTLGCIAIVAASRFVIHAEAGSALVGFILAAIILGAGYWVGRRRRGQGPQVIRGRYEVLPFYPRGPKPGHAEAHEPGEPHEPM